MTQYGYPKFIQILSHQGNLVALDGDGDIWFYITAHELHTGEKIAAHWAPIASMERHS